MPPLRDSGLQFSASIRPRPGGAGGNPRRIAESLAAALCEVVADPEFHAEPRPTGFIAAWLDGADWTTQAVSERADLARLWRTDPWRPSGIL